MEIDFRKIEVKGVDGKAINVDLSKTLGNQMYRTALSDDDMRLGKEIYDDGKINLNKPRAATVKKYIANGGFYAFIRAGINPILNKIIDEDKGL